MSATRRPRWRRSPCVDHDWSPYPAMTARHGPTTPLVAPSATGTTPCALGMSSSFRLLVRHSGPQARIAETSRPRAVGLVEGVSDQLALEALARRRRRHLGA